LRASVTPSKNLFRTLTVTEKVFELTASGDQFAIQIHTR
jgi:hypothetical protein